MVTAAQTGYTDGSAAITPPSAPGGLKTRRRRRTSSPIAACASAPPPSATPPWWMTTAIPSTWPISQPHLAGTYHAWMPAGGTPVSMPSAHTSKSGANIREYDAPAARPPRPTPTATSSAKRQCPRPARHVTLTNSPAGVTPMSAKISPPRPKPPCPTSRKTSSTRALCWTTTAPTRSLIPA